MIAKIEERKQKHRSATEWRRLVSGWKESGKTKRVWCTENGLSLESLRRWIKRFRGEPSCELSFIEVQHPVDPARAVPTIRVLVSTALQIELPAEVSEELLHRVLRAAVEVAHVC